MDKLVILLLIPILLQGCVALVPLIPKEGPEVTAKSYHPAVARPKRLRSGTRVQRYISQLNNGDVIIRIHAASKLGDLGKKAQPAVPALIKSLDDPHYWVRRQAAKSLGKLKAQAAIPALRRKLQDPDRYVVGSAKIALQNISN